MRASRLDAVLLVFLVPCWIAAFGLHVRQVVTGRLAWVPVYLSRPAAPDGLPVVAGFRPEVLPDETGLRIGDRPVRAGGEDLRGIGPIGVVARLQEQADKALRVPVAFVRGARSGTVELQLVPVQLAWRLIPLTLGFAVVGVLVLLRLPGSPLARGFLLAALSFSFQWTFFFGGPRVQTYAWTAVLLVATLVTFPLMLRVPMLFPPEVAPVSGRLPRWPWLFSFLGPIALSWVYGFPLPPAVARHGLFVVNVAFIGALLAVLTRNFRRAGDRPSRHHVGVEPRVRRPQRRRAAEHPALRRARELRHAARRLRVPVPGLRGDPGRRAPRRRDVRLLRRRCRRSRRAVRRRDSDRHGRVVLRRELRAEAELRAGSAARSSASRTTPIQPSGTSCSCRRTRASTR